MNHQRQLPHLLEGSDRVGRLNSTHEICKQIARSEHVDRHHRVASGKQNVKKFMYYESSRPHFEHKQYQARTHHIKLLHKTITNVKGFNFFLKDADKLSHSMKKSIVMVEPLACFKNCFSNSSVASQNLSCSALRSTTRRADWLLKDEGT